MQRSGIVADRKLRGRSERIEMKRDAGSCSLDGMGAFVFVKMGNKHFVSAEILSGCIRFFYESGSACTEWYSYAEMFLRSFF